ncbi:hypothetical protein AGMMS49587_07160 [Spirochaetia bacterium]|nr:hypothetical protein AGMMS49587_07160 [Spirochaetia bacterium]
MRFLPPKPEQIMQELFTAAQWALPLTVYASLLLSLSYSVRRRIPFILSIIILVVLAGAFSTGVFMGIDGLAHISSPSKSPKTLGSPGLILTQGDNRMILLREPAELEGSRVVSLPGQALIYQEVPLGPNNTILPLPPVPFRFSMSRLLQSLTTDFSLTGREFERRFNAGPDSFLIYGVSLIFLLVSLRFILNFSNWPLANLFLGALAFRGILTLETFLDTADTQELLFSFLGDRVSAPFITPLVLCILAILICLYSGLNWLVGRRVGDGD